ncbi:GntR family transcriptional regulator [Robertmurraya sp. DFI.2.37]|uniref:GntR family transcriptional regulator n=1 Tax=Robertmurraya sp. DFI.2.37 TaxID=3031819 RepID=UPI0021E6B83B|nr:GntR family transcriptional regulator [Robertmurraya sp. DFI.2.37]MDF1509812.1 GntR family transcriptional regulator [Robertmurraya sp. DFI.2.37]
MNELKRDILSLQLKPGTIISETTLSERYQISRTPIRDILKQLSLEDYINIYPKKGSIVSYIDLESVEQLIFLRSTLEKEIMKELKDHLPLKGLHELKTILAKQKECIDEEDGLEKFLQLDDAFHKTLYDLAGRGFLWSLIQQFQVHYIRFRRLNMHRKDKLAEIHKEHELMIGLLVQGETEKIAELVRHHLQADINSLDFQEHFGKYIKSSESF